MYTKGSFKQFAERMYLRFCANKYKDDIHDTIVDIGKYQTSLHRYEDEILQLAGVGPQLEKVQDRSREVTDLIAWLEEVLCLAMVDNALLFKMHTEGKLLYQNVLDSV